MRIFFSCVGDDVDRDSDDMVSDETTLDNYSN